MKTRKFYFATKPKKNNIVIFFSKIIKKIQKRWN